MNLELVRARLLAEEGERLTVYDDKTGLELRKGVALIGNPTIGVGRNLLGRGITRQESRVLLNNDIIDCLTALDAKVPWVFGLEDPRARVFLELCFQLGIDGLLAFRKFLAAGEKREWALAVQELYHSKMATQISDGPGGKVDRIDRMAERLLTGKDQRGERV